MRMHSGTQATHIQRASPTSHGPHDTMCGTTMCGTAMCDTAVCDTTAHVLCRCRDIKAENVLKNSSGRWVLCDFGSCTERAQTYETPAEIAMEEEVIRRTTTPVGLGGGGFEGGFGDISWLCCL